MGVSVGPGPTALTRMPYDPSSRAATRTRWNTPALDALYAPSPGSVTTPFTLDTATNDPSPPLSTIDRATAWNDSITPRKLTAMVRSHSSGDTSRSWVPPPTPAEATNSDGSPTC